SQYNDATAAPGAKSYYQVFAIDNADQQSTDPATANADRPADITAPAQPTGFAGSGSQAGIALSWNANSEIDLAGYNVLRSANGVDGWMTVNTGGLITGTSFNDTTAPAGATSFYQLVAVDASNNPSPPAP